MLQSGCISRETPLQHACAPQERTERIGLTRALIRVTTERNETVCFAD